MDTSLEKIVDGEVSLVWADTVCKILQCISVYSLFLSAEEEANISLCGNR